MLERRCAMVQKLWSQSGKNNSSVETKLDVTIDYPKEEELINPGHYAVRISTVPEAQVELSLNGGDWKGCRSGSGYFWYDWQATTPGEYTLTARQKVGK